MLSVPTREKYWVLTPNLETLRLIILCINGLVLLVICMALYNG